MTETRLMFFGRKFEAVVNQGIINQLETWLYPERFEKHYPTMDSFWLSLYHHHDLSPRPDDGLVTLGHSLSRTSASRFKSRFIPEVDFHRSTEHTASLHIDTNLIEVSVYKQSDNFEGLLVRSQLYTEVDKEQVTLELETWFKLENFLHAVDNKAVDEMQSRLRVSNLQKTSNIIYKTFEYFSIACFLNSGCANRRGIRPKGTNIQKLSRSSESV